MSAQHPSPISSASLFELIQSQANRRPEGEAILAPGRAPLTYAGLLRAVTSGVEALNRSGIGRGERVGLVLPNGPEAATGFLTVAAGAVCAPLNPAYTADEFKFYLSDLRASALIVRAGEDSVSRAAAHELGIRVLEMEVDLSTPAGSFALGTADSSGPPAQPGFAGAQDVALVLHTSGTTSRPKIVPLTHANVCASAGNIAGTLALSDTDRCLNVMPLFHIHGLMAAVLATISTGAGVVCTPGFQPMKFFAWLEEFQPTWYTAVPTMHQAILARAERNQAIVEANRLRMIRSSSAALPPQVLADLERVFHAPVIESYGMTEAAHQMASNPLPPAAHKPGSVGLAAGPEIAIMDESDQLLERGRPGEIVIRGNNVTPGYENNPEANRQSFNGGWFRTGDQGRFDEDGYLFITGRLKEIINRGGEKISPREVDEVLLDHPAVAQAVTFALPHDKLGEEVAAAIVLRGGAVLTEKEVREFASRRLADFKVPRKLVFLDDIPKGPTGKLQRIGLAKQLGLA